MMKEAKFNLKNYIISLLIAFIPGAFGSFFTFSAIPSWYATLNKPFFTPPSWLFGPAWTILYVLMGTAAYMVYQKRNGSKERKQALTVYGLQLVFNGLWSFLFFGLRSPLLGIIGIIILWFLIIQTIGSFYRLVKSAGLILLPYIAWVTFAGGLNFALLLLNP